MRTTVNLDADVLAIIDTEARRTGETKGQVISRLVRRTTGGQSRESAALPLIDADLLMDISDVSAVLDRLDEDVR